MGVLYPEDRAEWWAPKTRTCLFCGESVAKVAVFWCGADDTSIVLHGDCAADLGAALIADSREAALASGKPPWNSRATRAAVAAIEHQRR